MITLDDKELSEKNWKENTTLLKARIPDLDDMEGVGVLTTLCLMNEARKQGLNSLR